MAAESAGQIGLDLVVNQGQFTKQMAGIQGMAKKAGLALAAAFSIKKLADFSASCIKLGSDLSEVQNVVDVTFPQMRKQVDQFAKEAISSFGLSETMAKRFTGTFGAMAKAFGFNEKAAYEMSTTLTGLAGDVASFYNISQDEAYTKLKSVFTGETESLKDLGVVMTQAALDQYALANGFGKTTQAMSEAEKVALRYQFVQEKLALASGDFIRTSDSWANQVRVLKLQFDSLRASIGQGLIAALTPVIRVINTIIGRLAALAQQFSAFMQALFGGGGKAENAAQSMAGALSSAAGSSGVTAGNLGQAAKQAEKTKKALGNTGIDELNIVKPPESSGGPEGSGGAAGGGGISMPDDYGSSESPPPDTSAVEAAAERVKKVFRSLKDFLTENKNAILSIVGGLVSGIGAYFAAANWPKIVSAVTTAFAGMKGAIAGAFAGISAPALGIAAVVALVVAGIVDLWNTSERFRDNMTQAWDLIATACKNAWNMIWNNGLKPLGEALADLGKTLYGFYEASGLKTLFEYVVTGVTWIASIVGSSLITAISAAFTVILEIITGLINALTWIIDKLTWVFENWSFIWESIKAFFSSIIDKIKKAAFDFCVSVGEKIINTWKNISTKTQEIWNGIRAFWGALLLWILQKAREIFDSLRDHLLSIWESVKATIEETWTAIRNFFTATWENIKATVSRLVDNISTKIKTSMDTIKNGIKTALDHVKTTWTNIWEGLKTTTKNIFDGIWGAIKGVINNILSGVETMANGVVRGINRMIDALNNLSFDIPEWVPEIGGETFGLNIPTLPEVRLPRLAQGGFVRANTPQLAMIGDNRHYGEIVAPEDKMQEMVNRAVAMASGADGASVEYLMIMVDLLRRIIELIETMDLTVKIDVREIKKRLTELDKRTGYTLRTT